MSKYSQGIAALGAGLAMVIFGASMLPQPEWAPWIYIVLGVAAAFWGNRMVGKFSSSRNLNISQSNKENNMNEMDEIKTLLHKMEQSAKESKLGTSGVAVMSLVLGLTGIALALPDLELLKVVLWLLVIATSYNFGIVIYVIYKWLARKRKAK